MYVAICKKENAQKVKEYLIKNKLLDNHFKIAKEMNFVFFPLTKKAKVPLAKVEISKITFEHKKKQLSLKEVLEKRIPKKDLEKIPLSQEVIGDIAILEIPKEFEKYEKVIAKSLLETNKHIKTVVKKSEPHSGVYRLRKVKHLAGERKKETIHKESGVKLFVNLEKTYFSPRVANERLRIAKLVKKGEKVLVMFSGIAPYPLVISKHSQAKEIIGVEINPYAHFLAQKNVQENKAKNIKLYLGDVKDIVPKLKTKFDRIIMPLPKIGKQFLDLALTKIKKGGYIHLYAFIDKNDVKREKEKIRKKSFRFQRTVFCGQFSPKIERVCFDIKVR